MNIAQGSLDEVRYYLILARDLGYLGDDLTDTVNEVGRILILNGYAATIRLDAR